MSFDSLLVHRVDLHRVSFDENTPDERGQPTRSEAVTADIHAMVQPRTEREVLDTRSAGAPIGDHIVFMRQRDIAPKDVLMWDDARLEVVGIRNYDFGSAPHLEVDCRRIGPPITT